MTYAIDPVPLWTPNLATVGDTRMAMFMQANGHGRYGDLWQWSVDRPQDFWPLIWEACGAIGERGEAVLEHGDRMPGAVWFPQAKLNYAENLLKRRDDSDALVFWVRGLEIRGGHRVEQIRLNLRGEHLRGTAQHLHRRLVDPCGPVLPHPGEFLVQAQEEG